jgi:hypothetical protein
MREQVKNSASGPRITIERGLDHILDDCWLPRNRNPIVVDFEVRWLRPFLSQVRVEAAHPF